MSDTAIGVVVLTLVAAVCAVLVLLNVLRIEESEQAAGEQAATYSAPVLSASGAPPPPIVTVLGSQGGATGTLPPGTLLHSQLRDTDLRLVYRRPLRYVAAGGRDADTFAKVAATVDPLSSAVVLLGNDADAGEPVPRLADAVTRAIAAVQRQAPGAEVVVVGPLGTGGDVSRAVENLRATLRAAAKATNCSWVDPIGRHWLTDPPARDADGRLTEKGRKELAKLLAGVVRPALQ